MKEIIDEIGHGFMNQEALDALAKHLIEMYHKSDQRIRENNDLAHKEIEDEDDKLEDDDIEILKEENKNEYDLQLSLAEIIGIIFKTHKELSGNLVTELFTNILPGAINNEEKEKQKFALFILDDMVEFLGPSGLGS
jgi:hypothetical protein